MDHLVVYGNAQACWKAAISLERRRCLLLKSQVFGNFVHIGSRRTFAAILSKFEQNLGDDFARASHDFDFFGALQVNHH